MKTFLLNNKQLEDFFNQQIPCDKIYVQKIKEGQYPQIKFFVRCKNSEDKKELNQINLETVIQYVKDGSFLFTGKLLKEKHGYLSISKDDYFNSVLGGCCEKLSSFTKHSFSTIPQNRHYARLTSFISLNKNIDKIITNFFTQYDIQKIDCLKIKEYAKMENCINKYLIKYLKQYETSPEL